VVTQLKYGHRRDAVGQLGHGLARLLTDTPVDPPVEAVSWIPALPAHVRERGFDQGQELAREAAARAGLPLWRTLRRLPGPAQSGRSASQRRKGPELRAELRPTGVRAVLARFETPPTSVALIDDVLTTGSSAANAVRVLRGVGVSCRLVAVLAHRPLES
jgi:predicted amidophosphoribosyltransferase